MGRGREERFEDRGQSMRPPTNSPAPNTGGRVNSPNKGRKAVPAPPVARSRKDSVLRPVNDGGSSRGGIRPGAPAAPPVGARQARGGGFTGGMAPTGPARAQNQPDQRRPGPGAPPAPPAPRNRQGKGQIMPGSDEFRALSRPEQIAIERSMGGGPGSGKRNDELVAPGGNVPSTPQAGTGAGYGPAAENVNAQATDPGVPSTPQEGTGAGVSALPNSSPSQAGQGLPEGGNVPEGGTMDEFGNPNQSPDADQPQNDPEQMGQSTPGDVVAEQNEAVGAAGPDTFGGRMGESVLGFKIEGSDQIPNGSEWRGEIGPGMPSNSAGALGIPGQMNSPEDVAHNRTRYDTAFQQNKGDKFAAASSSGAYPSGNPIAHGTMSHMDKVVNSTAGDDVDTSSMDEQTRKRYKADAVKQFEEYGAYPGMDDPDSPTPPVRPLSWSFNPFTNKWTSPEGAESMLTRFGGEKA